jgi:chemotaxis protein CheD
LADKTLTAVHIGDLRAESGASTLAVYGLGSCVALVLFDPKARVGGLAHVLLPGPRPAQDLLRDLPAKYATEALDALVGRIEALGGRRTAFRAALVGGARLFQSEEDVDSNIGPRNASAARIRLQESGIPISAEEVGGTQGRTVYFHLPDLRLEVKTLRGGRFEVPLRP